MANTVLARTNDVNVSFTGTGNTLDLTVAGFGTPQAVIIFQSGGTGLGTTISAHSNEAVCFWDGTNTAAVASIIRDAQATGVSGRTASSGRFIYNYRGSLGYSADISAITDGIRLTCATYNNKNTHRVWAILIKGATSVFVGNATASNSVNGEVTVTAPGFQPDLLIATASCNQAFGSGDGNSTSNAISSNGFATRESGGIVNVCSSHGDTHGAADMVDVQIASASYICRVLLNYLHDLQISEFNSSGFKLKTLAVGSSATNTYLGYLAIKFADNHPVCKAAPVTSGTGNKAFTGYGGTPTELMLLGTSLTSLDSEASTADTALSYSWGVIDSAGAAANRCYSGAALPGAATSDSNGRWPNTIVDILQPSNQTAGTWHQGTVGSFDADGFTINMSTNGTGVTLQHLALAFVPGAPPSGASQNYIFRKPKHILRR